MGKIEVDSQVTGVELSATTFQIYKSRIKQTIGRLFLRLKVPGIVRDFTYDDGLTGQHIEISTHISFTKISVDGRDYYFDRFTGKFDGTGYCMCRPS